MNIVLDASITLAWCFKDEATEGTQTLLKNLTANPAYVPELWPLEIGNILISAAKRKRITYADATQFISLLSKLNINVDTETHKMAFHDILALAHSENLTTYDASYLELAMRKGFILATKDKNLSDAALRLGVSIAPI